MIRIDARIDVARVSARLRVLSDDIKNKVIAAAINKTLAKGKAEARRTITSRYAITSTLVLSRLSVVKATRSTLTGNVSATGKRALNVVRFATKRPTRKQMKKGVQMGFRFLKGGAVKQINGSFIGNSGRTVFRRIGDSREIEAVAVIGVPQMFNAKQVSNRIKRKMLEALPIEIERAMKIPLANFNR